MTLTQRFNELSGPPKSVQHNFNLPLLELEQKQVQNGPLHGAAAASEGHSGFSPSSSRTELQVLVKADEHVTDDVHAELLGGEAGGELEIPEEDFTVLQKQSVRE